MFTDRFAKRSFLCANWYQKCEVDNVSLKPGGRPATRAAIRQQLHYLLPLQIVWGKGSLARAIVVGEVQ